MEVGSPFPTIYEYTTSGTTATNVLQRLEHPLTMSINGFHKPMFSSVSSSDVALAVHQQQRPVGSERIG